MGGKTATSQSSVNIPPQVLAQYQAVNDAAAQTAQTPFQQYGGEFVAPVNDTQMAGIAGTSAAANEAQPFYQAATGTLGSAQLGVNPLNTAAENGTAASASPLSGADIERYLSPYLSTVLGSTSQLLNQNNQQQQAGQLGDAIRSGAFGGDRTGIAAANLEQQQNLANANIYSGIANEGYKSALSTAQGQQQIGLAGAQQLAGIGATAYGEGANTASELASLGAGAQTAGLSGAGAQINAGTVEQQTQQAQDTALYNQFLQQQSYPFQVDQFLANIAEGTGSLSGSTTTTRQPGGFFSDRRLKRDIKRIGKTYDGQDVVTYKMGDDERTHIGLIAQDVEKKHPDAVGLAGGFKTVDYGKATEKAANEGHFYAGGVVPFRRSREDGGGLQALEAQRAMYSGMPGSKQRDINSGGGGGGRSLPVANAPAAAPQTGASEVNQSLGIINNGYKTYHNFSGPSGGVAGGGGSSFTPGAMGLGDTSATALPTTSALPDYSIQAAGLQGSGAVTAPYVDATAAAAPAAEGAAADAAGAAAGTGAASAAGSAAAGAAGAGLVAGGTDAAAAEAAAALAAEYAAADVAVAAAVAAARGGRMKRDLGGGTPYAGSGSDPLDIPDDRNTNTLKAAPAAGKQPTGFQTMLHIANPTNWDSLAGSTLSNEALRTGGVAGRRGMADGGDPDTGDDTVTTPVGDDATVTASGPSADDQQPSGGVAPPSGGGIKGFWNRNKGDILPALEAIGAMGTARTVHPGVALAAGLEAGAKAYPEIQTGLAEAERRTAIAKGQEIQNQMSQIGLDMMRKYTQGAPTDGIPTSPVRPDGMAQGDPSDPQEQAFQRFAPLPTALPDSVTNAQVGLSFTKNPEPGKAIGEQYVQRITNANQIRARGANQSYLDMSGIANNQTPGQAFAGVQKLDPKRAAQWQQSGASADQLDQQARTWASQKAFAAHQWSNRPADMQNGVLIDKGTNAPVTGSGQLMLGMTASEKQAAYVDAITPKVWGAGLPEAPWQHFHFPNPEAFIAAQDRASRISGAAPGAATAVSSAPPSASAGPSQNPVTTAPPAKDAPAKPATAPKTAPPPPATPHTGDSFLDSALSGVTSDRRYQENPGPAARDQPSLAARNEQAKLNVANKQELITEARQITDEQAAARQYLLAAQHIMQSPNAPLTGAPGYVTTYISQLINGGQASSSQVLAKNLINAAQQQFRTNFKNGTQSEFQTQVGEMSPNKNMTPQAIMDLTNLGLRTADYMSQSADRALLWAKTPGVDALAFNDWNQNNFKREVAANATQSGVMPDGSRRYKVNGRWVHANGR